MKLNQYGQEACGREWPDEHHPEHTHECTNTAKHVEYRGYFHKCGCGIEVLDAAAPPPPPPKPEPPYKYRYRDDPDGEWD